MKSALVAWSIPLTSTKKKVTVGLQVFAVGDNIIMYFIFCILTGLIKRGFAFSTANVELGEGMWLCSSNCDTSAWTSGTRSHF